MATINGYVGVSGALISATGGYTATSGSDGKYVLTVPTGARTITPSKTGYTFDPASASITVSGNIVPFNPVVDDYIYDVEVQTDGSILLAGLFTTVNGAARSALARITDLGVVDATFAPVFSPNIITKILLQPDGKILAAGSFTSVNGVARTYLARLNANGTLDTSFNCVLNSPVTDICLQSDGKILICGYFTTVNGNTRTRVARLATTGALDATFAATVDDGVNTIQVRPNGTILVGGQFSVVNGVSRPYFVCLESNGTTNAMATTCNGIVTKILVAADNSFYIGGSFSLVNGTSRQRLAGLDSSGVLTSFDPQPLSVSDMFFDNSGRLVMLGGISLSGGREIRRFNLSGVADSTFTASINGALLCGTVQYDDRILIGGEFTTVDSLSRVYIARLNDDSALDNGLDFMPIINTYTLTYTAGTGGAISGSTPQTVAYGANGTAVSALADPGYTFSSWSDGSTANPRSDTNITGNIIVSASFAALPQDYIIEGNAVEEGVTISANMNKGIQDITDAYGNFDLVLSNQEWTLIPTKVGRTFEPESITFTPDGNLRRWNHVFNGDIWTICPIPNTEIVFVGGAFTSIDGVTYNRIVKIDANGDIDPTFLCSIDAPSNGYVTSLLYDAVTEKLYIGGNFSSVNGVARSYAAAVDGNTGVLDTTTFMPSLTGIVRDLAFDPAGGAIYLGGWFSNYLRAYDTATGAAISCPVLNGVVYKMVATGTGLYIGGNFTTVGGVTKERFAKLAIAVDHTPSLVVGFTCNVNAAVRAIGFHEDISTHVFVGGQFTTVNGASINRLAKVDVSTGSNDPAFQADVDGTVHAISYLLCIVGEFSNVNSTSRTRCARLYEDTGALRAWNPGVTGAAVYDMAHIVEDENDPYACIRIIGGQFSAVGGHTRTNIARTSVGTSVYHALQFIPSVNQYTLTYLAGDNGSISGTTPQTVAHGSNGTTVTAVPDENYVFASWSDGVLDAERCDYSVMGDITVTASFEPVECVLEYTADEGGSLVGDTLQSVSYGGDGTAVTAVAANFYRFVKWSDDSTDNPRQDLDVQADISVEAEFDHGGALKINSSVGTWREGAIWHPMNAYVVVDSGLQTITFSAVTGYITPDPIQVIVTEDTWQEIDVTYVQDTLTISGNVQRQDVAIGGVLSDENGDYSIEVAYGSNVSLTPVAEGYYFSPRVRHFQNVLSNFVDQDHLAFEGDEPPMLTLNLLVIGHGSVSGGGEYLIDSEVTITAEAETGWVFSQWSDGNSNAERTFTLHSSMTLTATFVEQSCTITTSSTAGGTATPASQTVGYGNSCTIVAIAAVSYVFVGWYIGEARASTQSTYIFQVTGSLAFEARFILANEVPIEVKEVCGEVVAELGVDDLTTMGKGVAIGIQRVNDTIAYPLDEEYLAIKESSIALQTGDFDNPTDSRSAIQFGEKVVIADIEGQTLDFTSATIGEINTTSIEASAAEFGDMTVTGVLNLLKGDSQYIDQLFATGYIHVGQAGHYTKRIGAMRYTGALCAGVTSFDENTVILDSFYDNVVGCTLIYRGDTVEYTILSQNGLEHVLDKPAKAGEVIILTAGDWEGWNGEQWVSFTASGGSGGGEEEEDFIPISNITDLQKIGYDPDYPPNGVYRLVNNIDASETASWNGGAGFEPLPIGGHYSGFNGSLDGNGFAIDHLTIERPNSENDAIGLFKVASGTVTNLHLRNAAINGGYIVGGLVGHLWAAGTVTGCTISGTVDGVGLLEGMYSGGVGGLIGNSAGGTIEDCKSYANVTAIGNNVGGLIGWHINNPLNVALGSHTSRCCALGDVTGNKTVGGLIGYHTKSSIVADCYAVGNVTGVDLVGGLVGLSNFSAHTTRAYAIGIVTATGPTPMVGALLGGMWTQQDPGLPIASISDCYYNEEVNPGLGGEGTPKSANEMQDILTFVNWDFNATWEMIDYPILRDATPSITGVLRHIGDACGFNGATPVSKQMVSTGTLESRVAQLEVILRNLGFVV